MSLHKPTVFTGVATALITPFSGGAVDFSALGDLIDLQIFGGARAVLIAGSTGEAPTLSEDEILKMISFCADRIGGRIPLLCGCGSNSTDRAVVLARERSAAGADALLSVTPYYNKGSDRGIFQHFRLISEASSKPLLVYNVPSRTGVSVSLPLFRELAKLDNVVGVKEASGDLSLLSSLVLELSDDLDVYTGNDDQFLHALRLGAAGIVSVYSNLFPARFAEIYRLASEGDFRRAFSSFRPLLPQIRLLFSEVNPIPVKFAASHLGLCSPELRLPLTPPSPDLAREIEESF